MSSQPSAVGAHASSGSIRSLHADVDSAAIARADRDVVQPLTVLIVSPSLHAGAADAGAVQLVRILAAAGHRPIVVSSGGRLVGDVTAAGATFIPMNVDSTNPVVMLRNALALARIVRERALRRDPRAWARARLERLLRRAARPACRS